MQQHPTNTRDIESDVTKACEILTEIAGAHPAALREPQPWVVFDKFGDSMFELELVVWSIEMSYRPRAFRSDLNFEIERRFRGPADERILHRGP